MLQHICFLLKIVPINFHIFFYSFQGHTWLSWQLRTFQEQYFRSDRARAEVQCNQTCPSYREEDCQSLGEEDFALVPQKD